MASYSSIATPGLAAPRRQIVILADMPTQQMADEVHLLGKAMGKIIGT